MNIIFSNDITTDLSRVIDNMHPKSIYILVDENTRIYVLPKIVEQVPMLEHVDVISIKAGDSNKDVEALAAVWKGLGDAGATRSSMLINVGGGMVTDLGAFAASTFKRGIKFVNIPTTLLAAVDASVGGKTGINFNGLKNEVGVFKDADAVIITTCYFDTLPTTELRSGYAEMIKHAYLTGAEAVDRLLAQDVTELSPDSLLSLLKDSVEVKKQVVAEDPTEKGIRRSLNLGHTAGHAFEAMAMKRKQPIPHGYAVAYGLVVALILSHMKLGLDTSYIYRLAQYVKQWYGSFNITCNDYPRLLEIMGHDKKNERAGEVCFTLLAEIGKPECGIVVSHADIKAALDIYRDLFD